MKSRLLLVAACSLLCACVPVPDLKSPKIVGYVTDARTHRPVPGASVNLTGGTLSDFRPANNIDPKSTVTDSEGRFTLGPEYTYRLVFFVPADFPPPSVSSVSLTVTSDHYHSNAASVPISNDGDDPLHFTLQPLR